MMSAACAIGVSSKRLSNSFFMSLFSTSNDKGLLAVGNSLSLMISRKNHQFADYLISYKEIIGLSECLIPGGIRHMPSLVYALKAPGR